MVQSIANYNALDHCWGNNLYTLMVIILFYHYFDLKVTGSLIIGFGPKTWQSAKWGFNWQPSAFNKKSQSNSLSFIIIHYHYFSYLFNLPVCKIIRKSSRKWWHEYSFREKGPILPPRGKRKNKKGVKLHKNQQKSAKLFKSSPYFD